MTTGDGPVTATGTRGSALTARNAVALVFALNGFCFATLASRVPDLREALGLSNGALGALLLSIAVGSMLGPPVSGHLIERWGAGAVVRFGALMDLAGLTITGFSAEGDLVAGSAIGLFAYGLGTGTWDVAMNVEGAEVEREMGRTLMPWFHASWSLGTVAGAALGAGAAALHIVPAIHLVVIAAALVVAAFLLPRLLPRVLDRVATESAEQERSGFRAQLAAWAEPRTLLLGVLVLGMAFAEGSANDWLALAMTDDRDLTDAQGALLFGVFSVAMTAGRIAGVPLLDRFGRVLVLRVAVVMAAVGLAVVILVPIVPIAVAGIVVWGLGAALGFPVGMSAAGDDPVGAAARVSAVATIAYCAFLVGPPLIGFVGEHIGILNALWIVFGLIVIAGFAVPAARERKGTEAAPVPALTDPAA